jgi:hypothetical protein
MPPKTVTIDPAIKKNILTKKQTRQPATTNATRKRSTSRKSLNRMKKSIMRAREGTILYEAVKMIADKYDNSFQPEFTANDKFAKSSIWNIRDVKGTNKITSALSDEHVSASATGDHIYGMREIDNKFGSNSEWNLIPCTQAENVSWKKVRIQSRKSGEPDKQVNLVTHTFSEDEKESLDTRTRSNLEKFNRWKAYVKERNATMFYDGRTKFEKYLKYHVFAMLDKLTKLVDDYDFKNPPILRQFSI